MRDSSGTGRETGCVSCPYWEDSKIAGSPNRYQCAYYQRSTGFAVDYKPAWCLISGDGPQSNFPEVENEHDVKTCAAHFVLREDEVPYGEAWLCVTNKNHLGYQWIKSIDIT